MKKKLFLPLAVALLACGVFTDTGFISSAKAESVLFVAPTRVNLNEKNKVEVMNLSNQSDIARHYKISIQEIAMKEDGLTNFSPGFPNSAKSMIKFYPREITIQPGERQAVRVMAKIPADTPDGQYHAHIEFFEDGKSTVYDQKGSDSENAVLNKSGARAGMAYSALLPIIVSKGNINTQINWIDPKLSYDSVRKIYKIDMKVTRSGNGQGTALFDIFFISASGEAIQLGKRRTVQIYREIDQRQADIAFVMPEAVNTAGGKIKLNLLSAAQDQKPVPVAETFLSIP